MVSGSSRRRDVLESLRELRTQLVLLNHGVGGRLRLRVVDLDCLDLVARHGALSPSALARLSGLHPATLTGVLDRLERGGWVARERDPDDRRAVVVRPLPDRVADIVRLYGPMTRSMTRLCADYSDDELELIAGFLRRAALAGHDAATELPSD